MSVAGVTHHNDQIYTVQVRRIRIELTQVPGLRLMSAPTCRSKNAPTKEACQGVPMPTTWPLAGDAGLPQGRLRGLRSCGAGTKMPFELPIRRASVQRNTS
jgi:hypothetical protein